MMLSRFYPATAMKKVNDMQDKPRRKTKTSQAAVRRYREKVYDQISVSLPKELCARFKQKCSETGVSQASVIKKAIEDFLS